MWTRVCLSIRIASTNATTATVLFLLAKHDRRHGNILGYHQRKSTTTTTTATATPLSISAIISPFLARLYRQDFPPVRNSKMHTQRERWKENKSSSYPGCGSSHLIFSIRSSLFYLRINNPYLSFFLASPLPLSLSRSLARILSALCFCALLLL